MCNNIHEIPLHGFSFETKEMICNKNVCENIYGIIGTINLFGKIAHEALTKPGPIY